ncbi:type I-F CRISPR-associated helicase Cas3f [Glaciecola sp. SC05]|uniref:type I-F CRISPR-associated helicase Cas3f n=1 Tax=Glaciecola sp. SC05 TaxID=1987355 RepID=UPI0035286CED
MMVTFVSQCEKNALKKTRRVLDAFADRIGDNTWQTVITEDGLLTVKKMLRQTASKSTAVSCHWIRSRARSQFLWVVGNRRKFNELGVVPVNSTAKKIQLTESSWEYLQLIRALTAVAALLHDWGKATKIFQDKLKPEHQVASGDPIRHEWISCILLDAFIRHCAANKQYWLHQLAQGKICGRSLEKLVPSKPEKLFVDHDAVAQLLMWLIVSHHRLPLPNAAEKNIAHFKEVNASLIAECLHQITQAWGYENRKDENQFAERVAGCFEFPNGLMTESSWWLKDLKRWAAKLETLAPQIKGLLQNNGIRLVLHHARLCLMLGDHHYSSQPQNPKWRTPVKLFANTDRKTRQLKQKLDEHLVGVKKHALNVVNLLPIIQRLEQEEATAVFENAALRKQSLGDFAWQQKAVNCIAKFKKHETLTGAFIVNMASTGCGKTFANAKIMQALSPEGNSLRYVLALGLRTLTLQTGDEYRDRVGLSSDELAVLIGSKAVSELHNQGKAQSNIEPHERSFEEAGSESLETLLDNDIDFSGVLPEGTFSTVLTDERARKFLYAPVLACTIDHMMGATETKRGGRYILPSLRLLSSDLVIDEVDDFSGEDLAAIGRLVHLAGMLGRKVMISSATIPPALAAGFFNAYRLGWQLFGQSQNQSVSVCSIWVDEFHSDAVKISNNESGLAQYVKIHGQFIQKRVSNLAKQPAKRKANIVACELCSDEHATAANPKQWQYFNTILQAALDKHNGHNTLDVVSRKQVSFGVIRVANIPTCVELTRFLLSEPLPENTDIRVMAYHSQQVLLMRHAQERHLDLVLKRKEPKGAQPQAFSHPVIREHIDNSTAIHFLFILVATPVEEVGRDHDFDWAVVEPSSYRSIIQLAGRVRRHRAGEVSSPNVGLLQYNWKAFRESDQKGPYFVRPGYEEKPLPNHDVRQLLDVQSLAERLDAVPRIQEPTKHTMDQLFAGIEHKATKQLLTQYNHIQANNIQGYLQHAWWLTALPQTFQAFRRSIKATNLFYVWDKQIQRFYWAEKDDDERPVNRELQLGIKTVELNPEQNVRLWLQRDYELFLIEQANKSNSRIAQLSLRYGELNLTIYNENDRFEYSPQLGMYKVNKGGRDD